MDINHISVSRKKTYEQCAQTYKYRYHLKLVSPNPEPFYFVYGTTVHKIAELYVKNKGNTPIGEIAKDIMRGKIPIEGDTLCPEIPEDYKKKLVKHLRAIQNLTAKIGSGGIVEKQFRYDLDPPNDKCVTGFIDRLIIKQDKDGNKKAFIIDYKTTKKGKWRVNADTVKTDLQLRTYARVVQREYGIPAQDIKAALYYLEGENLIAAQYSDESLLQVEDELRKTFYSIERSDPDKVVGTVGWHCKQCDYNSLCQFYKAWQNGSETKWDGNVDALGHDGWDAIG